MKRIKKELRSIISSDPNIRNGLPVFKNTRVPVYTVIEHISLGYAPKDLQEAFPAVKLQYVMKLLRLYSREFKLSHETKR